MCTLVSMSGRPPEYGEAVCSTAEALNQRHRPRGGVLLNSNDNFRRIGRHEDGAAPHSLGHPRKVREPGTVRKQSQQLGVLGEVLKDLRGGLKFQRAVGAFIRFAAVEALAAHDLSRKAARMDRERSGGTAARAAEKHEALGVGHGGLQAGDRHRGRSLDTGDGRGTR